MAQPPHPFAVVRRVHLPDARAMHDFLLGLSKESRRNRFHSSFGSVSPSLLARLVSADDERHAAWVACIWGAHGEEIIGEAVWYVVDPVAGVAELAISVRDEWHGTGVADQLMAALVRGARQARMQQLYGDVLVGNARMLAFMRRHGLEEGVCDDVPDLGSVRLGMRLGEPAVSPKLGHPLRGRLLARLKAGWR
ncbi:GNAT family N-acetyltransferase [Ramlibacter sp. AN1015]|uniref:GNAT family N-acetyltransferase n=1 Tax=Ramlibacter sp. AN1015 TaxID=3133428 RepID=UPI0030BB53E3